MKRKAIILFCTVCLLLGGLPFTAFASDTFRINGVEVRWDDFKSTPGNCRAYAEKMYRKIWGTGFSSDFDAENNFLRNLSQEELELTEENLKEYVSAAALGSTIRVSSRTFLYRNDGSAGHSQIIVQKDSEGFTVLEGGMMEYPYCGENYYTWSEFVNAHWLGGRYGYIKYIKWPGAPAYSRNYDRGTPEVSSATVVSNDDNSGFSVSFTADDDVAVEEAYIRIWPQGQTEALGVSYRCSWDGETASASVKFNYIRDDIRNFYCTWYAVDARGNVGRAAQPVLISLYEDQVVCSGICQVITADAVVCNAPYADVNGEDTQVYPVDKGASLEICGVSRNADGSRWYRLTNGWWISDEHVRYDTAASLVSWRGTDAAAKEIIYHDGQVLFICR